MEATWPPGLARRCDRGGTNNPTSRRWRRRPEGGDFTPSEPSPALRYHDPLLTTLPALLRCISHVKPPLAMHLWLTPTADSSENSVSREALSPCCDWLSVAKYIPGASS